MYTLELSFLHGWDKKTVFLSHAELKMHLIKIRSSFFKNKNGRVIDYGSSLIILILFGLLLNCTILPTLLKLIHLIYTGSNRTLH